MVVGEWMKDYLFSASDFMNQLLCWMVPMHFYIRIIYAHNWYRITKVFIIFIYMQLHDTAQR